MSLEAQTPEYCPNCGYDPTGDDDKFVSGGGWEPDHFITDGIWTDQLRCPRCGNLVAQEEKDPMFDGGEEQNSLNRLFDEDHAAEAVIIDDVEMDAEEFIEHLDALADAAGDLSRLATDVAALRRTGLRDQDVIDLLYGRNAGLTKTTIETVIDTIDDVQSDSKKARGREKLLRRLVADLSGETQADTQEVFDELAELHQRYGGDSA